ncbi:MAG TPA: pyruvate carboxylase subunit B [Acidobacteriota bacterium]|nr:pyruvate carboxylase subunit B [Acidobacteriota bacterium]
MTRIEFVDQTIRDAQQSLWGLMMRTDHIAPIAETMDRVGYRAVTTVGSQAFTLQVRHHREDPWERIRLLAGLMPRTCLRGSYQTASLSAFDLSTPRSIIELWIRRSVANGIRSFWVCDYQENVERFRHFAHLARAEGAEVVTALMYTASPAHTLEYWARQVHKIVDTKECVDRIMIEDASGVLTPERTRELVAVVQAHCEGIPLEFHAHCNSGLAPLCCLEAVKAGVTTIHTAVAPLANGTSLPATETMLRNIRRLGFEAELDEDALAQVSAHFRKIAETEGFPLGVPMEYDLFHFEHQVPGGMMSNLARQLRELGMDHRMDEILDEVIRVRSEFGYPVMATPYSQIVGVQAMENVVSGERYRKIPDETIKYALGYYGAPVAPFDPDVMDRIMSLPRTGELTDWMPEGFLKSSEELRREIDPELSDDDLLLRVLIPGKPAAKTEAKRNVPAAAKAAANSEPELSGGFPREFSVEVDGDVFNVRISPRGYSVREAAGNAAPEKAGSAPEGAVFCGMAGLVLSLEVKEGDRVGKGDAAAVIEAMKMRRQVCSPRAGTVREIRVREGETVKAEDVLMVVL